MIKQVVLAVGLKHFHIVYIIASLKAPVILSAITLDSWLEKPMAVDAFKKNKTVRTF